MLVFVYDVGEFSVFCLFWLVLVLALGGFVVSSLLFGGSCWGFEDLGVVWVWACGVW